MTLDQQRLFPTPQEELTSDDYYTPAWIFDALGLHFDLDVASPPGGPPFVPCDQYYTQEDDGLAQPWHGRVWMNPPFSGTDPWARKWIDHGNGVALLPCSRARWFSEIWEHSDAVVHPRPGDSMFNFYRAGKYVNIYMPVVVCAIGSDNVRALSNLGRVR